MVFETFTHALIKYLAKANKETQPNSLVGSTVYVLLDLHESYLVAMIGVCAVCIDDVINSLKVWIGGFMQSVSLGHMQNFV